MRYFPACTTHKFRQHWAGSHNLLNNYNSCSLIRSRSLGSVVAASGSPTPLHKVGRLRSGVPRLIRRQLVRVTLNELIQTPDSTASTLLWARLQWHILNFRQRQLLTGSWILQLISSKLSKPLILASIRHHNWLLFTMGTWKAGCAPPPHLAHGCIRIPFRRRRHAGAATSGLVVNPFWCFFFVFGG